MMDKLLKSSHKELEEIPVDIIVNTGIRALNTHPDKIQVFKFLLIEVPKTIDVSMLDDRVFQLILPELHKFINERIEKIHRNIGTENICNLNLISSAVKLLYDLLTQLSQICLQEISTLVLSMLEVLQTLYAFCKMRSCTNEYSIDIVDAFKTLFSDCQRLQSSLLAVIIPQNMKQNDARYTEFITKLMSHLCKTAEEITALDVRSTAEIWKSLMKISTVNAAVLIEKQDLKSDCFVWLSEAATFLTSEILLTVEKIIGKNTGTCAAADFDRHLKIISFYVKLLLRFLSDYNDTLWDQEKVFDALVGLTRCFYILEDKMSKNAYILLTNDIQNLLFAFTNGNQLLKFLSADLTQNTALPRLIICIRLIERIITDITAGANSIYLDSNFEILQVILKCILNGATEDLSSECFAIYSKLVASITALIVCVCRHDEEHNEFFESFLIPLMLQSDIHLAVLAIDVFTLWARYQTPKQCLAYLMFCSNIAENSPIITSYRLSDVFVKILIQNLYDTLDNHNKEQFLKSKPVESNFKTWIVLGFRKSSLSPSKCIQDAECALEKCFTQPNAVSYYSMIDHISLLSSEISQQITVPVNIPLRWIAMDEENAFSALSIAFLRLASRCVLSLKHIYKMLTKLTRMYDRKSLHTNIKIEILNYLCKISMLNFPASNEYSKNCCRTMVSLIGKLYRDDDVIVREECVILISLLSLNKDIRLKNEITDLLKCTSKNASTNNDASAWPLNRKVQYLHKCDIKVRTDSSITLRGNGKRRLTLGFDLEIDEATELTFNLERDTNALAELHRVNGLSQDIIQSIGKVINTLSEIK